MFPWSGLDLVGVEGARILRLASAALAHEPRTITSVTNPRSAGGPHDFSSDGDYWWPDPAHRDGPYIRRDGETNPDNFVAHRRLTLAMATDVGALAAAWSTFGDARFASAAVRHLRAWFVDLLTRMNPSLHYAQAITGRATGRPYGIIDSVHLAEIALAIDTLRGAPSLAPELEVAISGWFREYLSWITTHPYGVAERDSQNNHATCWLLQAAAFATLVHDDARLNDCRRRFKDVLLPTQMASDGSFPNELRRTKPYAYSIFSLDVMAAVARLLSSSDEDLVAWSLPDGRGVARGVEFLAPFLADKNRWPHARDVQHWDGWPVRQPALLFAGLACGRHDWLELWQRLTADPTLEEVRRNFPIRQPVLWVRRRDCSSQGWGGP